MKRPMLFDTILPPGNRCRLRFGDEEWEMEKGDGLPYAAVWAGEKDDRFLLITFPDGREIQASSICLAIEAGEYPLRQQNAATKKKPKKAAKPQSKQIDLFFELAAPTEQPATEKPRWVQPELPGTA
jgi:hypothetical protein